jgi:hypothetical protein
MEEFVASEVDLAATFYGSVDDPNARSLLDFMIDHPDQRFDGATLASRLGWARNRDVGRATFELGKRAAALGRKRPWREAQLGYLMEAAQADLLRRARDTAKIG